MPYVKSTVHITRIAGAALKSFTHGYAQTVVAASQSSHAASNTPTPPLYDTLLGRFRKNDRSRLHNVYDGVRQASTSTNAGSKPDSVLQDSGLDKYLEAWQRHQRSDTKEWQQYEFAKRIEWQPPTVPVNSQDADVAHDLTSLSTEEHKVDQEDPALKRSYTTSAVDNFGKAFLDDDAAEIAALEQVNNAIAEEVQRAKSDFSIDSDHALVLGARSVSSSSLDASNSPADQHAASSPATIVSSESQSPCVYTEELLDLAHQGLHDQIPVLFQQMLRAGVQKPSTDAYRVLLNSAIELTQGFHQKIPRALEVYSDMIRRGVIPDKAILSTLVDLLSKRTRDCASIRSDLESRRVRYGGLDQSQRFMFASSLSEYNIVAEDSSLSLALKMFDRAVINGVADLSPEACASLIVACAEQGLVDDMRRICVIAARGLERQAGLYFPAMIAAFGVRGDLKSAVDLFDEYKTLAIANNAGENTMDRNDNQVYASLIKAFGAAGRPKSGLKFLARIQADTSATEADALLGIVSVDVLVPQALKDGAIEYAFDLALALPEHARGLALNKIVSHSADNDMLDTGRRAFDMLPISSMHAQDPATAMLAMHIRNTDVEAAEPYWRILEAVSPSISLIEPTTMRAVALVHDRQPERGLRQARRMFARVREVDSTAETTEQLDEAIDLLAKAVLQRLDPTHADASFEILRMMMENGGLIAPTAEHIIARLGPEQIARATTPDVEFLTRVQAGMILNDSTVDLAGPARFACLLENITSRHAMPSAETETLIERTLINIDRADLSQLWNTYRYPPSPAQNVLQGSYAASPHLMPVPQTYDDSFDPYAAKTDVKGSNAINELLDRPRDRQLNEALTRFRNMRRVARVPRMFTYAKLIESACKENKINVARDVLEMAKQDVPFDVRYRVVRYGWQQILDNMVAGCLGAGRRDLAAQYHQDLLQLGATPSANTFGIYITTLKETTKAHDEASEAVKIFLQARREGVEPTSFLYNALIGKLSKARRIDDCLFYFAEMRNLGIRPTSVTFGTIVNALVRVSDDKFAEEIFEEMEACANYKPRPAPYHSLMQFFLSTKRDRGKVLAYYERMRAQGIEPTTHTYKLLVDTYATLEPIDMTAAERVLVDMTEKGIQPEAVHYAALVHAKGCVVHDMQGAKELFDRVVSDGRVRLQPCLYQALFECLNANRMVAESDALVADMTARKVEFTPYIANALIHGWTLENRVDKARAAYDRVPPAKREPSTYSAMVRAYLATKDRAKAMVIVREALSRGYPSAVASKIADLVSDQ